MQHNTCFKKPSGPPPRARRSPTPPHAYIESLSPRKPPAVLEPAWAYPALRDDVRFAVPPGPATIPAATPRLRAASTSYKTTHQRTPSSTIDTLAEAALAVSPSYQTVTGPDTAAYRHHGVKHGHSSSMTYGASEPPHKRARSELLPSPQVGAYASRPATSYEHSSGHCQPGRAYETRVEDAALLLNFRTGGWPPSSVVSPTQTSPAQPLNRPHANSFPQDPRYHRPAENTARAPLIQPADLAADRRQRPRLPSPKWTPQYAETSNPLHNSNNGSDGHWKAETDAYLKAQPTCGSATVLPSSRTELLETASRGESTDVTPSEASEGTKSRRGWPKGKPRGAGARKTKAAKAVTKRATGRRKTADRSKLVKMADDEHAEVKKRRWSLSDLHREAEKESEATDSGNRSMSVPSDVPMHIKEIPPSKIGRRNTKVVTEIICAGCSTARQNSSFSSEMDEWISCNGCKGWFHIDCAGFNKAHEIRDVDKYFCASCESKHGKTTYVRKSTRAHASVDYAELQRGVLKTSEESMEHHYIQGIKDDALFPFDPETFPRMRPEMVTRDFFERSGVFVEPVCIPADWNPRPWTGNARGGTHTGQPAQEDQDGDIAMDLLSTEDHEYDAVRDDGQDKLDMVMPEGLTVRQVANLVGADTPLDVIDVKTQNSGAKWNLGRWVDYYEDPGVDKDIKNVISLEVSQTKLGRLLRRPKIVRDIDLQDAVWPQEEIDRGKWPKVQYYCLMSAADSYTDFHIDFGGSSVYYHILRGKKTFFFIPPKQKHLKAYEEWNESPQQNFTFLPNVTQECYRVDLSEGDTMLIPSGWIHAVWTPETSLVIGGNFLTRMSFKNQFKVVEIEKANRTPMKFRYPFFQRIMWYTALQYLQKDPLPPDVRQLYQEGKRFERERPIWQDFDGDMTAAEDSPSSYNARYYSQPELDGLPDLVNYIFRTVMIVKGMVEGTSADQMKRINTGIPKGHGDPLELVKTFALWVSWKCGSDPPSFAHPDWHPDTLPSDEGPKKLSARAMKELERKEATAAWRAAPERVSERQLAKNGTARSVDTENPVVPAVPADPGSKIWPRLMTPTLPISDAPATSQTKTSSPGLPPPSPHPTTHQMDIPVHQSASPSAPPMTFMMDPMTGQHISTPKTSVLGPKRVACDACRKRRIKCKHKDLVIQASDPPDLKYANGLSVSFFHSNLAPELHDHVNGTPGPKTELNGRHDSTPGFSHAHANGNGPNPGTNAYVTANIPMTMNGVPIFGEMPKRGRSKACFECRKSKRRCVHDETGNVDPVKAAENPVPRGSATKKRPSEEADGHLLQVKKQRLTNDSIPPPNHTGGQTGVLMPQTISPGPSHQPPMQPQSRQPPPVINEPPPDPLPQQPEIDPSLFSYPEPAEQHPYINGTFPYPPAEPSQQHSYEYPSLEQIANEVLDMNGRGHDPNEDFIDAQLNAPQHNQYRYPQTHQYPARETIPGRQSQPKPDGSVDSAVSLPSNFDTNGTRSVDDRLRDALAADGGSPQLQYVQNSAESNGIMLEDRNQPNETMKTETAELPLYQPLPSLSQSPEQTKRQPVVNGTVEASLESKKTANMGSNGSEKSLLEDQVERASGELHLHEAPTQPVQV